MSKMKDPFIDKLCAAVLTLKTEEECYQFFEDIATVSELKAWAQRLYVAKLLNEKATYEQIAEETGASTATISRVKRCLFYGSDGYKLVLDRMKDHE